MKLGVHYSPQLADLLNQGHVEIDYFKCPAWPDVVAKAKQLRPTYVHFPLRVGCGIGNAVDTETHQPVDWAKVETLLAQSDTCLVNVHLAPTTTDYPDIPVDTTNPDHILFLTERLVRDVEGVVRRLGAEHVIVENDHDNDQQHLRPALLPHVIRQVVEATGCGFLLDLSHARLAARYLGLCAADYIHDLPVEHTREIHVTGLQVFDDYWIQRTQTAGIQKEIVEQFAGRLLDHLPMTDDDWTFFDWAMDHVRAGTWGLPWVVAFEYSGVGPLWEAVTDPTVLAKQIPRLYAACQDGCRRSGGV